MPEDSLREFLYEKGYEGVFYTLNWPRTKITEWLAKRMFGSRIDTIIDLALTFDRKIADENVNAACHWVSEIVGEPITARGVEGIPREGPVLLASNHPGLFDSMMIAALLPRRDLKIIAGGVHYFAKFPHARKFLLYLDKETDTRVSALRAAIRHLRDGGCVLIFPTGETDPDPDFVPGHGSGWRNGLIRWV